MKWTKKKKREEKNEEAQRMISIVKCQNQSQQCWNIYYFSFIYIYNFSVLLKIARDIIYRKIGKIVRLTINKRW